MYIISVLLRVSISVFASVIYLLLITKILFSTLNSHNSDPFYPSSLPPAGEESLLPARNRGQQSGHGLRQEYSDGLLRLDYYHYQRG